MCTGIRLGKVSCATNHGWGTDTQRYKSHAAYLRQWEKTETFNYFRRDWIGGNRKCILTQRAQFIFMKILFFTISLFCNSLLFAQQQFSTKEQALNWLTTIFEQKFVKSEVKIQMGDDGQYYDGYFFDYTFTDTALIIYKARRYWGGAFKKWGLANEQWFILPFYKIDKAEPSTTSTFFNNTSNLTIRSNCRCFKRGEDDKVRKMNEIKSAVEIEKNTDLVDGITIPFNLIDGPDISQELINAFKKLSSENNAVGSNAKKGFDNLNLANEYKKSVYRALPRYDVFTIDSAKVTLPDFILSHRQNRNKPTLLISWTSYFKIGLHEIDTLLLNGLAAKYNVVLVSRDNDEAKQRLSNPESDFSEVKKYVLNHSPRLDEDALVLFDRANQMEDIDNGTIPILIWMDKDLNIIYSCAVFIDLPTIKKILSEIDNGQLQPSKFRFYLNGLPSSEDQADTKTETITDVKTNSVVFKVYKNGKSTPGLTIEYTQNKNGKLFFQKMVID